MIAYADRRPDKVFTLHQVTRRAKKQ
ncbi:hypothetical protein ACOY0X_003943, partial [Escherichia coli]